MKHDPVEIEVVQALLDPGYELDLGAAGIVTELLEDAIREKPEYVPDLVRLINADLSPEGRRNLLLTLRQFLPGHPDCHSELRRACKRRGRVLSKERQRLVMAALDRPDEIRPMPSVHSQPIRGEWVLSLNKENTSLMAAPVLIDMLHSVPRDGARLTIAIEDFVYASGLAIVATWCSAARIPPLIDFKDSHTEDYCKRIGFLDALDGRPMLPDRAVDDWAVGLTEIRKGSKTEDVTQEILEILDIFVAPRAEDRSSLGTLLGEIIENVDRHARAETPGYVVAQVYPGKLKLGITIADAGIGIPGTFRGAESPYREPALSDSEYLRLAIRPLVTSKPSKHSGYGLYILSELIGRNRGTFLLASGGATLVGYRQRNALNFNDCGTAGWDGTIVSMIVDLNHRLPIREVYDSLPLPEGYSEDDFFDD